MEHFIFVNVKCFPQYSPLQDFVNMPTEITIDIEYQAAEAPPQPAEPAEPATPAVDCSTCDYGPYGIVVYLPDPENCQCFYQCQRIGGTEGAYEYLTVSNYLN
jgi:hypothetical protein